MLQWHDPGSNPLLPCWSRSNAPDAVIGRCQEWLADNYASPAPVSAMAAFSNLPERSFVRRFSKAAGMTPLDYVHAMRLEEAKQILERSDMAIEVVANEVGYEDASFFSRLFRRKVGLTPAQYRLRFSMLRMALASA